MARGSKAGWKMLGAAAVVAAPVCAQQAPAGAPPAPVVPAVVKTGDVEVTVTIADSKAVIASGMIYAKTKQAAFEAAGQTIRLTGVPVGRTAVTVDAQVKLGVQKGTKRYLGVVDTGVQENGLQKVSVSIAPVAIVDDFCSACHPDASDPKYKPVPGLVIRDIHVSGKEFPKAKRKQYLASIKEYNDRVAKLEKAGKPHNLPVPLEERLIKVGGKDVKSIFYTCESCHTPHQWTAGGKYARAPFRERGDLCKICHI